MWDVLSDGVVHGFRGDVVGRFWWTPREPKLTRIGKTDDE
jgi:hypothetical protein